MKNLSFKVIEDIRFEEGSLLLSEFSFIKIEGDDRERFLQGQLTNDLSTLSVGESQLTCRLNRTGQIMAYAYLVKSEDFYFFIIENSLKEVLISDLEKFVIMDDVKFSEIKERPIFYLSYRPLCNDSYSIDYAGERFIFSFKEESLDVPLIDQEIVDALSLLSGQPKWNKNCLERQLVNETTLNQYAVDYSKGCFLGQETAAKIETRRGAARYPVLLVSSEELALEEFMIEGKKAGIILDQVQIDNLYYAQAFLKREYRVENKTYALEVGNTILQAKVLEFPFFSYLRGHEKAQEFYEKGSELFQKDQEEEALNLFKEAVAIDPGYSDAHEVIGVILGRHEKYEEAIGYMDDLLKSDPNSVMAHTNKSLYLMKLGRIEEAEEEKANATVASFAQFGREAASKKEEAERKEREIAEIKRREEMFSEVLEIDQHDLLANYGLADISYSRGEYEKSLSFLEVVLKENEKYSIGYLLKGKNLVCLERREEAKDTFEKGIKVATLNGDLMPANEMQSRLLKITNN